MWWVWTAGTGWADDLRVGAVHPYQSLAEALLDALPGDRIVLDAGRYVEDTDLVGVDGLEIAGAGSDPLTGTVFAGGDGPSQWHLDAATNIILRDLAIDGENARRAINIVNGSSVDAWNVRFARGAQATGAGIAVVGSTLSLYGATVDANVSTGTGGGLHATSSVVWLEDTLFSGNQSAAEGGAAWIGSGTGVDLFRSTVIDNTARSGGGVACASALRCTIDESTFERNVADDGGGGLYLFRTNGAIVLRTSFCDNVATTASGGGLNLFESSATIENTTFLDDRAGTNGGGLLVHASVLNLENNTFVADGAGSRGGAVYQDGDSSTRSVNNVFVDSSADGSPFAAVDADAGVRTGGWDLYFGNVADAVPGTLPNDRVAVDPLLTLSEACEPPRPANPGPAIDAGDPQILDPDLTRSDLGATGGPGALRDQDGDGTYDGEDCNDGDAGQNPDQPEDCDGADDDCDGWVDEGCVSTDPRAAEPLESAPAPGCGCRATGSSGPSALLLLALRSRGRRGRSRRT